MTSGLMSSEEFEGHVALRHPPRFKTKASSAPVPGLLSVQ